MSQELWGLDLDSLQTLYSEKTKRLTEALLQGAKWSDTEEIRRLLTQLSIIIDRKREGTCSPVDNFNP